MTAIHSASSPTPFNLANSPLFGSALIEASAGTGKTYSLAFLYLRFILEAGYSVEEILVTTFTKAAVAELKERLFARLLDVDKILHQQADKTAEPATDSDPFLVTYLQTLAENLPVNELKKRLQQAITQFDQAQIHTIDGFALQLYQENTLNISSFPIDEVVNDNQAFIEKVFYQMAGSGFANCACPEKTAKVLTPLKNQDILYTLSAVINQLSAFTNVTQPFADSQTIKEKFEQLSAYYQAHPELITVIHTAIDEKAINRQGYSHKKLDEIDNLLRSNLDDWVTDSKNIDKLVWLGASKLLSKLNAGHESLAEDYFYLQIDEFIANLEHYVCQQQQDYHAVMLELAGLIKQALPSEQLNAATLSHQDITQRVSAGAKAGKINHPFAVAMIDESQDTSPAQLALFKSLFIDTAKHCFFVGDPKQAIYGFRGADIYSYLAIRSEVKHHYILDTNHRSSLPINQFINDIFSKDNPFIEVNIDYYPIHSDSQSSGLSHGSAVEIVKCSEFSTETLAKQCALQIANLLTEPLQLDEKPLKPGDIAVLVRSDNQAKLVKSALSQLAIPAAHKGKDSIYNSEESILFYWLLEAITSPRSSQIKRLLVSPLFNYSFANLHDEALINDYCHQFQRYQSTIESDGFTVTLNRLLREQHIGYRLLNQNEGSRRLTNFLHIFETLQQQIQRSRSSIYSALQWLAERINQHEGLEELRLDDDNAVTIQTIHKSKGLQYPIVYLPFLAYENHRAEAKTAIIKSNVLHQAAFFASAGRDLIHQVAFENAAENRRLSYVALTRAQYKNILFIPSEETKQAGDLLNLLAPDIPAKLQGLITNKLADLSPEIALDDVTTHSLQTATHIDRQGKLSKRNANFNYQWLLDSFSGLTRYQHHDASIYSSSEADNSIPTQLLEFPKGAVAGTALHEVFELYMATRTNLSEHLTKTLNKYLINVDNPNLLNDELASVLATKLVPHSFSLNDIDINKQAIEMKFFLHLTPKQRQLLYQQMHTTGPAVDSYLHGFIDLMFYHKDKYYILDYKSNFLGPNISDYNQANMHLAMQENAYYLQALIYTIAIDKHLTLTHKNYDYSRDFGGVYYLFLRGMQPQQPTGIYHFMPKQSLVKQFSQVDVNND